MNAAREEAREFRRYCIEGMLFEVQDWLRAGKPVPTGGEAPLALAAGKGFHSLVKLLLDQGASQDMLDVALACAGKGGHLEVCRMLLDRGANIRTVRAADVLGCGNPDVEDFLMTAGMDIETGSPITRVITDESKAGLAFFKRWRRRSKAVRRQGAMALKYFVANEDEWRATWVKKAGADPRLEVPHPYPRSKSDRWKSSALEYAVLNGTFRMLVRMGVRKSDDIPGLLSSACVLMDRAKIMHILKRGGLGMNDLGAGGSSILHRCLIVIGSESRYFGLRSDRGHAAWELAKELTEKGARWVPDKTMVRDVRHWLRHAEPKRCVEIAQMLVERKAATREAVAALFGTPMIQRRLGKQEMAQIKEIVTSTP